MPLHHIISRIFLLKLRISTSYYWTKAQNGEKAECVFYSVFANWPIGNLRVHRTRTNPCVQEQTYILYLNHIHNEFVVICNRSAYKSYAFKKSLIYFLALQLYLFLTCLQAWDKLQYKLQTKYRTTVFQAWKTICRIYFICQLE